MKQYTLDELGLFSKDTCEAIKARFNHASFMDFEISYSNCAGNCTLIIATDYEATEQEIKNFFLFVVLSSFK